MGFSCIGKSAVEVEESYGTASLSSEDTIFAERPCETGSYEICVVGGALECSWEFFPALLEGRKQIPDDEDSMVMDQTEKAMRNRVIASITEADGTFPTMHSYTKILEGGKLVGSYKFQPGDDEQQKQQPEPAENKKKKKKPQAPWLHSNTQASREKAWESLMRPVLRGGPKVADTPRKKPPQPPPTAKPPLEVSEIQFPGLSRLEEL